MSETATAYYQRNREVILNRAKDYYENNKELLRERERGRERKINTENYLKKKKILQEKKKIIVSLKNMLHKCKYVSKSALQRYLLFALLLFFKRQNDVLII